MNYIIRALLICLFSVTFVACESYKVEHSYHPPKSSTGKMCAVKCVQSNCRQHCEKRKEECQLEAKQEASKEYDVYRRERLTVGREMDESLNSIEWRRVQTCENAPCDCVNEKCYEACGGEIETHQVN